MFRGEFLSLICEGDLVRCNVFWNLFLKNVSSTDITGNKNATRQSKHQKKKKVESTFVINLKYEC